MLIKEQCSGLTVLAPDKFRAEAHATVKGARLTLSIVDPDPLKAYAAVMNDLAAIVAKFEKE